MGRTVATSYDTFNGNGVTTAFTSTFTAWDVDHIDVWVTDSEGTATEITSNLTVVFSAGSTLPRTVVVTYPVSGDPVPTGSVVTLINSVPLTQEFLDLQDNGSFQASVLEDSIDRVVAQVQRLDGELDRCAKTAVGNEITEDYLTDAQAAAAAAETSAAAAEGIVATFIPHSDVYTATAGQTDFTTTFNMDPDAKNASVYVDGVKIVQDDITFNSATSLTLTDALAGGEEVEIVSLGSSDYVGAELPQHTHLTSAQGSDLFATQADQEAATSTSDVVSPGTQQFHPSALNAWATVSLTGSGGTYTRSGSTITVSVTGHGLSVSDYVLINFDAGTPSPAVDGYFQVATAPDADTFTVTDGGSGPITGGTCDIRVDPSVALATDRYNVTSVTDNGTGDYTITLTNPMSRINAPWFGSVRVPVDMDAYASSWSVVSRRSSSANQRRVNVVAGGPVSPALTEPVWFLADPIYVHIGIYGGLA